MRLGEVFEERQPDPEGGGDVPLEHRFTRMMADTTGTAQEQHRNRHSSSQNHRIVSGAAINATDGNALRRNGALQRSHKRRAHRDGTLIEMRIPLHSQLSPRRDLLCRATQGVDRRRSNVIRCMTNIETRFTHAGDDVGAARRVSTRPTVVTSPDVRSARSSTAAIHSAAPAAASRRAAIGVVPAWFADPVNVSGQSALSDDGADDGNGDGEAIEHGALFDVEFEIAKCAILGSRVADARRVQAEVADGVGDGSAVRIDTPSRSASRVPASARLPMNGAPKRTPSSSENPTTSIENGSGRCSSSSTSATPARRRARHQRRRHRALCRDASR